MIKKIILAIWTIFIFISLVFPQAPYEDVKFTLTDKIIHLFLFAIFSFLLALVLAEKIIVFKKLFFLCLFVSAAYAGLMEYLQSFLPTRTSSFYDFLAGLLGVILALGFYYIEFGYERKKT